MDIATRQKDKFYFIQHIITHRGRLLYSVMVKKKTLNTVKAQDENDID